jgi:hypothetical protein
VSGNSARQGRRSSGFRRTRPIRALRDKEWTLLQRDPWLMSQILMQLLYLLPPAFILWRNFHEGSGASTLLVPILIIAAGQLAGGLAWLAISGEDAPDLIASAPVTNACVLRAKTGAVMGGSLSFSAPSSPPSRSSPRFPHLSRRWGSPLPPLQPRPFSSGFAPKRSAATFGAAKLRRVLPLLPRRCRRVAGLAPADWQQPALGSPPSPDLSLSQLSPAHGSLARRRALRTAHLGRSTDELDRRILAPT